MSTVDMTKAAQAQDLLMENVFVPHFFAKLAEYGIQPSSEVEAHKILYTGHRLYQAEQLNMLKRAETSSDFWDKAASYLDQSLGASSQATSAAENVWVKQATEQYLGYDAVVQAALALQDAALAASQQ